MSVTCAELFRFLSAGPPEELEPFGIARGRGAMGELLLKSVALPGEAGRGDLAWLRSGAELEEFGGSALLVAREQPVPRVTHDRPFAIISCDQPRRAMSRAIWRFFTERVGRGRIEVHPTARVHDSAVLGPYGQGYVWVEGAHERWEKFPQVGGIEVDGGAEIGPCSTVMCAAIGTTRIGQGARIGNGVNVGHGAHIGENALLSAHVTVGGGVKVGSRAILWQNVAVAHGVHIGEEAIVGMGSTVIRDVPPGQTWAGNPARPIGHGEGI